MRKSTDLHDSLEDLAARSLITGSTAAVTVLKRGAAGNDDALEEPASSREELDVWARHTFGASGFGDAGDASDRPTSADLHRAAVVQRAFGIGEIVAAMLLVVGDAVRQAYSSYRQWRLAAETHEMLQQLGDRELKDLGLDRSELASVAAEAAGSAPRTRTRASRIPVRASTAVVRARA
jgi:uncharacterized protein YjiS (DUF1127 family)